MSVLRVKFCVSVVNKNIFSWKYRLGSSEWWAFISHWRCVWICTYDGVDEFELGGDYEDVDEGNVTPSVVFSKLWKSWKGVVKKEREIKYIYCCCIKKNILLRLPSFIIPGRYNNMCVSEIYECTNRIKKCFAGNFWF